MSITFAVDEVEPAGARAHTVALETHYAGVRALSSPAARALAHEDAHPLLHAVHVAFAEHRRLVLTPDMVWLTIAQGLAQHVRLNAERFRRRLVRHEGRETIVVKCLDVPTTADGWMPIVDAFRVQLGERIGDGRARLFTCDFSTTTPASRVASEIVLMDAMSPYFKYELSCVCGIPAITLEGTIDDWRRLRARIDVVEEFDLARWARSLRPIADQLVRAAEGAPDVAFWRSIYKPKDAYGGDVITGWVARLFPYLRNQGAFDWPNPLLDHRLDARPREHGEPVGIRSDSAPAGLSQAELDVRGVVEIDLWLLGGLLGTIERDDGAIAAEPGFAVRDR